MLFSLNVQVVITRVLDNPCLLSAGNSLFTQLLCLAVLQGCCTVKRFSAVTFTSRNLQNKIIPSVEKYFSPNSLTKPRKFALSKHFTLGILKVETLLIQYPSALSDERWSS